MLPSKMAQLIKAVWAEQENASNYVIQGLCNNSGDTESVLYITYVYYIFLLYVYYIYIYM